MTAVEGKDPEKTTSSAHLVNVSGDATGSAMVAGNHNLVVMHGATLALRAHELPKPDRRELIRLLPARQHKPVGRTRLLDSIKSTMESSRMVQLWGPAGVGKSALLRYAATTLPPGPDGVVFVSASSGEIDDLAQAVFEACYASSGYAPSGTEFRSMMAGLDITVYVDNADFSIEQLRSLRDTIPDATLVFASRDATVGTEGTAIEVPGLDPAASMELLERQLPHPLPTSAQTAARDLCENSGGLPLLLIRAASLAVSSGPGEIRLPQPGEITGLILPMLHKIGPHPEAKIVGLLATLNGAALSPDHVGQLTGLQNAAELCQRLVTLGLLLADDDAYRCAPDVLPLAQQLYRPFPVDQLCQYFTSWSGRPATKPSDVSRHAPALAQATLLAQEGGHPDLAVRLVRAASPCMARALRFGLWGVILGQGWSAARASGDKRAEAFFLQEESTRCRITGKHVMVSVLTVEALVLLKEMGDIHSIEAALQTQHALQSGAGTASHISVPAQPTTSPQQMIATHHAHHAPPAFNSPSELAALLA